MVEEQCSKMFIASIKNFDKKCQFVRTVCESNYLNFYELHYCTFDENSFYSISITLFLLFLCFYILTDTANKYLSTALTIITDTLNLSPNLAAMTFLAFGNGAPDVISSIVASDNELGDLSLSIGALIGGGLCVACFVFGLVIYKNKISMSIEVVPHMYRRELLTYLISLLLISYYGYKGSINFTESVIFLSIYVLNLLIAFYYDVKKSENQNSDNGSEIPVDNILKEEEFAVTNDLKENLIPIYDEDKGKIHENHEILADDIINVMLELDKAIEKKKNKNKVKDNLENDENKVSTKPVSRLSRTASLLSLGSKAYLKKNLYDMIKETHIIAEKEELFYRVKHHYFNHMHDWDEMNLFSKFICLVFQIPLTLIRDLSMPAVSQEEYIKYMMCCTPISSVFIVISLLDYWDFILGSKLMLIVYLFVITGFTLAFYYLLDPVVFPKSKIVIFFLCIYKFIVSIVWIYASSQILIDIIQFYGFLFDIPESFLGLTILAFGNSLSDASLDVSLAQKGFGEMALAGTLSGPLFNLLFGLGLSMIRNTYDRTIAFNLWEKSHLPNCIGLIILIVNLIFILVYGQINNYRYEKNASYIAFFIFSIYLISISYVILF